MPRRRRNATTGLSISAMNDATMTITTTLPAARAAPTAPAGQRQQHELDPARDHDARWARRHAGGSWGGAGAPAPAPAAARVGVRQLRRAPRRPAHRRSHAPLMGPVWLSRRREHPVLRRPRRRHRPAHAARAAAAAARAPRPDVRRRQRRERRRRARHHAEDRRRAARRRRRRDHARQPRLPPPRDLPLPRRAAADPAPRQLPARPARARPHASSSRDGVRLGVVNLCGNLYMAPAARRSPRPTRSCASWARSTTSSSTCTPRRPARRSRWAGTSTAA